MNTALFPVSIVRRILSSCSTFLSRMLIFISLISTLPAIAFAQISTQHTTVATGAINDSPTCAAGTTIIRNFIVGTGGTIQDVDFGILAAHENRNDLRISVTSPSGTTAILIRNDPERLSANNINTLFDDQASLSVDLYFGDDPLTLGTEPVPYFNAFIPSPDPLSVFNGENATGFWRMEICDEFTSNAGTFMRADLYIRRGYADLSLSKTVSNPAPASGSQISYTLTVSNAAGPSIQANNVRVRDILPVGIAFVSAAGTGTYDPATGIWNAGSIPANSSRSITIFATVTAAAGTTITNQAEIISSTEQDIDSTPNNASVNEDDDAQVSLTVGTSAGIPPDINQICTSAGVLTSRLDWDNYVWANGAFAEMFAVTGIGSVNFSVTSDTSFNTPLQLNAVNTGGMGAFQQSLHQNMDTPDRGHLTVTTVTLPTAVPGVQFTVFDLDTVPGNTQDRLIITGSYQGNNVAPILTNGNANSVSGNIATGTSPSASFSADGNVIVTFDQPVDSIIITYNGRATFSSGGTIPESISIYDFVFCLPVIRMAVTKINEVISDPVNLTSNPKAIPDARVRYCLTISNGGTGTADNVNINDPLPPATSYVANSLRSGLDCISTITVEDDDPFDGTETDGITAAAVGNNIIGHKDNLGPSESFALSFEVVVN